MVEPVIAGITTKVIEAAAVNALKQGVARAWKGYKDSGLVKIPARKDLAQLADFINSNMTEPAWVGKINYTNVVQSDAVGDLLLSYLRSAECITLIEHIFAFRLSGRPIFQQGGDGPLFVELQNGVEMYGSLGVDDKRSLFRILVGVVDRVLNYAGVDDRPILTESAERHAQVIANEAYLQSIDAHMAMLSRAAPCDHVRLSDLLQRYRQAVVTVLGTIQPPNFDGAAVVPIDELYVAPALSIQPSSHKSEIAVEIHELFRYPRVIALGDPGGGKTTLTRKLAYDLARGAVLNETTAESDDRIPLVIVLRDFAHFLDQTPGSVAQFVEQLMRSHYQLDFSIGEIEWLLGTGRVCVIFDGLDELLETSFRQKVSGIVQAFAVLYPSVPVIVTSRRVGYMQAPLPEGDFEVASLGDFEEDRVESYVRKWFKVAGQLTASQQDSLANSFMHESATVSDLRRNPLMLALMCTIYRAESYIPRNRPDVYEKCARMLFDRWDRHRGLLKPLEFEAHVEPALMYLAYWIYVGGPDRSAVREREIVDKAADYLQKWQYEDRAVALHAAREFAQFCRGRAWVFSDVGLSQTDEPLYHFTHRTFLEYFAAAHLARTNRSISELANLVIPRIFKGEWDVVSQLALQTKAKAFEGGADEVVDILLTASEQNSDPGQRASMILFVGRCLSFLAPSPSVTKRCARYLIEQCIHPSLNQTHLSDHCSRDILRAFHHSTREIRELLLNTAADTIAEMLKISDPAAIEYAAAAAWHFNRDDQNNDSGAASQRKAFLQKQVLPILKARFTDWPWAARVMFAESTVTVDELFSKLGWPRIASDYRVPGFDLLYNSILEDAMFFILRRDLPDDQQLRQYEEPSRQLIQYCAKHLEANAPVASVDNKGRRIVFRMLYDVFDDEEKSLLDHRLIDFDDDEFLGVALVFALSIELLEVMDGTKLSTGEDLSRIAEIVNKSPRQPLLGNLLAARLSGETPDWPVELLVSSRGRMIMHWATGELSLVRGRGRHRVDGEMQAHYDRLAPVYDQNWAYSPRFLKWMTGRILVRLRVGSGDRILDVGCGTGLYARRLAERTKLVVCADPSARMLEQIPDHPRLVAVQASAEDLVVGSPLLPVDRFEAILVKEAIHHVSDRGAVIDGLARFLAPGGRLLVVMLPARIDYPLFQAAHARFTELQPDPEAIATAIANAGLAVELSYDEFPLALPTERYLAMVRDRYMSLLSTFDDEEIAAGVEEIRHRYPGERVEFKDRFAFVLGTASSAPS